MGHGKVMMGDMLCGPRIESEVFPIQINFTSDPSTWSFKGRFHEMVRV